ncbi:MAG: cytochrome, partial [Dactylosporangium sp.]|nr:cytochrome [Dactylosporangium sp.]
MDQRRHFRLSRWVGPPRSDPTNPPAPTPPGGLTSWQRAKARVWRRAVVLASGATLVVGVSALPALAAPSNPEPSEDSKASVKVLVFHGPAAQQDDPVGPAAAAIKNLGEKNGFRVDESENPGVFTFENLARYRGVVMLSAKGVTLSADQERAFQLYINNGGGFVGVHDAARAQAESNWFTGLIGTRPGTGLPTPEKVVEVTASGENPPNESKEKLVDGNTNTKWLTFQPTGWVTVKLEKPVAATRYALTSANDFPGRDPKDWKLQGSPDGTSWTDL